MGFLAVENAALLLGLKFTEKKCKALVAETYIKGEKVVLAKPQTYMNLSGESVKDLMGYYHVSPKDLLVFYDDYDLPLGALRIRPHGSAGTHNGMRSIVKELGSTEFARVRIGIKPPEQFVPIMDYVLADRSRSAREAMAPALDKAARAGEAFARGESMDKIGCAYNVNL